MISEKLLKSLPASVERFLSTPAILKDIFDAIPVQIVVKSLRPENFGEFLIWNKMAEEMLGISADEAIGRSDLDFFPGEQANAFATKDREVAASGISAVIPAEFIYSRTKGFRLLRTTKTPVYDEEGVSVALLAVSEDITEREQTEAELRGAVEFLENVNSELPGAVFQLRVDRSGNPSFPYISTGIHAITGDSAVDILSGEVSLFDRIFPEDIPGFLHAVEASQDKMSTCRQEYRIVTVDGEVRWVFAKSSPTEQEDGSTIWHGFLTDVTEQKRIQEALTRGKERLRNALDAMQACVWEYDIITGELHLSPEWNALFGYESAGEVFGLDTLLRCVHPEDVDGIEPWFARIRAGEFRGQIEFRHQRGDGQYSWVRLSGKPIWDADGRVVREVGAIVESSEQKRMERQLIEAKESAERASQAKGDFLAMMSHEIRTPLNAVLGFSDLLAATPLTPEQSDYLQTIQDSSSALLVVLNDVLDYSKIESGKLDLQIMPIDITKVIRSSIDIFRAQAAAKGLKIHANFSPYIPQLVLSDAVRLSQIVHNLLSNAVKFTEMGEIVVDLSVAGPMVDSVVPILLQVRDTGIGIDLDQHTGLFDPFYQADSSTRRRRGGTGLGLAIVRRLITLLKGDIQVQSTIGQGTTFSITLPLELPDQEEPLTEEDRKRMSMNLSGLLRRILIVEDNSTNRRLVRLFLKKLGYDADEAENGFVGVSMASRVHYDVIFMDLEMPGMDGYEAAQQIRQIYGAEGPYIVALTAHAMPEYRERSFNAGMQAYLSKPVKRDDLAKVLKQALRR